MVEPQCPTCEKNFSNRGLGQHFNSSSCGYPEFESPVQDWLIGLLMGDATISKNPNGNCFMRIRMVNQNFLVWLDNQTEWATTGVRKYATAEEMAKQNRENGFRPEAEGDNYQDVYDLQFRSHPYFNELRKWYSTGQKRFPDGQKLNSEIVKMWYVCDGDFDSSTNRSRITATNESDRHGYLKKSFNDVGFSPTISKGRIVFSVEETIKFLNWLGQLPPGFKYKSD